MAKAFRRTGRYVSLAAGIAALVSAFAGPGSAEPLAKVLFGGKALPAATKPASYGFYSKGCFSGGVGLAPARPPRQAQRH